MKWRFFYNDVFNNSRMAFFTIVFFTMAFFEIHRTTNTCPYLVKYAPDVLKKKTKVLEILNTDLRRYDLEINGFA